MTVYDPTEIARQWSRDIVERDRAHEALREIVILLGGLDPADGEGTSPEDVVEMVKAKVASHEV